MVSPASQSPRVLREPCWVLYTLACIEDLQESYAVSQGYGIYPDHTANNWYKWVHPINLALEPKASTLYHVAMVISYFLIASGLFCPNFYQVKKLKRDRVENFQILEVNEVFLFVRFVYLFV